jgi:Mn2+/Fe2+ NRAMP family transporter
MDFRKIKKQLLLFFAVIGPGLITAMADNDASGVATYSVAAAMYGMASQYFIIVTTLLLAITQDIGARIAIVTGKGLGDLIRENHGVKVTVSLFLIYFFVNQVVVLQDVSGLKTSIQLLGGRVPWQATLILACALLIFAVIKLNYKYLQRIFFVIILFYAAYIFSAVLSHPNWSEALRESLVYPKAVSLANPHYWFVLIAVLGTTVTAWGQFFINSFVADKGIRVDQLKQERTEIYFGAFLTNFFSWMIAAAVTYTLFIHKIPITDGYSAAAALRPFAGNLAYSLFAVGLLAASFLGLTIVPLATAYVFTEFFGYERTLNAKFLKGRAFYMFFVLQIAIGLTAALFPNVNLFRITLFGNFVNGAILPIILFFLIQFAEDPNIMGDYKIKGFSKYFLRGSAVVITFAVLASLAGQFIVK